MKWFKHDANAILDSKLKKLRLKYGMEGYGLYWYCLECIARNVELYNLTFELEEDAELISVDTNIHRERVEEMMQYMVNLKLFECSEGVITCLKMRSRTDEYTQKLLNKQRSRQCSDNLPIKSELIEKKKREENKPFRPKISFTDEDMAFSLEMKQRIEGVGYSVKESVLPKWANTIRLMRERDGIEPLFMREVFIWANNNDFWSGNIRSADSFREQFEQLKVKMALKQRSCQKEPGKLSEAGLRLQYGAM